MDAKKVAKFIVNGYTSNKELFDKLFAGGIVIVLCKVLNVPVALKSDGVSIFDTKNGSRTDLKDFVDELPWSDSPQITAIHYILKGVKASDWESGKADSARKIFDIAIKSDDKTVRTYAMKALSRIQDSLSWYTYKTAVENYIIKLTTDAEEE